MFHQVLDVEWLEEGGREWNELCSPRELHEPFIHSSIHPSIYITIHSGFLFRFLIFIYLHFLVVVVVQFIVVFEFLVGVGEWVAVDTESL